MDVFSSTGLRAVHSLLASVLLVAVGGAGCAAMFGLDDLEIDETQAADATGQGGATASGGATSSAMCTQCADTCCDGACIDVTSDAEHCGGCGQACAEGERCCDSACVDVAADEGHCGACDIACPGTTCFGGECTSTCAIPYSDCDKNLVNGCEADVGIDPVNCGSCGLECVTGALCDAGVCACAPGLLDCDGNPVNGCETDSASNPMACGACDIACGANQACDTGSCACAAGFGDCNGDPEDGCEAPLDTTLDCGVCGKGCGAQMACVGAQCACVAGTLSCDGDLANGCEASQSDVGSCGACDVSCSGTQVCNGASCVSSCAAGQTLCGASCVNVLSDLGNCGGCGVAAGANQTCVGGVLTCNPGFADCNGASGCETGTSMDPSSCGGCGVQCKPGSVCVQGSCVCAASTPKDCGAACRVCCSNSDCGDGLGCTTDVCAADGMSCAHQPCAGGTKCCSQSVCQTCCADGDCPSGQVCSGGICASGCPGGKVLCDGGCVDVTSDPNHCGGCNLDCGSDGTCACSASSCTGGTIYFSEDFSDNFKGWTLESTWQIGPTSAGSGQLAGNPDPAFDHSASADNGVAGVVLGGNYGSALSGKLYLISPPIDLSSAPGTVKLTFWRWLNGGGGVAGAVKHMVEVLDGGTWVDIYKEDMIVFTDSAWTRVEFDVTPYKGSAFRVRFSYAVQKVGAVPMSGWNIDDVTLSSGTCQ